MEWTYGTVSLQHAYVTGPASRELELVGTLAAFKQGHHKGMTSCENLGGKTKNNGIIASDVEKQKHMYHCSSM